MAVPAASVRCAGAASSSHLVWIPRRKMRLPHEAAGDHFEPRGRMNAKIKLENHDAQEIKYTTCYMCACRCGIKVTLEDNKVRFIQGNRNHPTNQGVLCAKGSAGIMKQYSTAKLTQPLMRKPGTERGEGIYEPISWEQALDRADRPAGGYPCDRPVQAGVLYRARPDAGADRPVGAAVRHPQLVGARRFLFGQHGGGRPVFHRLLVLGIRRARLGLRQVFPDVGRGGRPLVQPDQDRPGKAQAPGRQVRHRQPGAHRLLGDRRRMAADQARHGRPAGHVDGARAAEARAVRLRIPGALHQCLVAGGADARGRRATACSCATRTTSR